MSTNYIIKTAIFKLHKLCYHVFSNFVMYASPFYTEIINSSVFILNYISFFNHNLYHNTLYVIKFDNFDFFNFVYYNS